MKIICEAVLGYFDIVNIISGAVDISDTSDLSWAIGPFGPLATTLLRPSVSLR